MTGKTMRGNPLFMRNTFESLGKWGIFADFGLCFGEKALIIISIAFLLIITAYLIVILTKVVNQWLRKKRPKKKGRKK